jgi:hypothetical protein
MDFFGKVFDDIYDYGARSVDSLWQSGRRLAEETTLDQMLSGVRDTLNSGEPINEGIMDALTGKTGPQRPRTDPNAQGTGLFASPQSFQARRTSGNSAPNIKALESEWIERMYRFANYRKASQATQVEAPRGSR